MPDTISVVCGILPNPNGELLIAQRAAHKRDANKWEFPGGKTEPGETPAEALQREWKEEFGMDITVNQFLAFSKKPRGDGNLLLMAFLISASSPTPAFLTDHKQVLFLPLEKLGSLDLCPSDRLLLPSLQRWFAEFAVKM